MPPEFAFGAGGVRGESKAVLVVAQVTTVSRAELRKGTALVPRKGFLRSVDGWGLAADKGIRA